MRMMKNISWILAALIVTLHLTYSCDLGHNRSIKIYLDKEHTDCIDMQIHPVKKGTTVTDDYILFREQDIIFLAGYSIFWIIPEKITHAVPECLIVNSENMGYLISDNESFNRFLTGEELQIRSKKDALDFALLSVVSTNTTTDYVIDDISQVFHPAFLESIEEICGEKLAMEYRDMIKSGDYHSEAKRLEDKIGKPDVIWDGTRESGVVENIYIWNWITGSIKEYRVGIESNKLMIEMEQDSGLNVSSIGYASKLAYVNYDHWEWSDLPQLPNNSLTDEPILVDSDDF